MSVLKKCSLSLDSPHATRRLLAICPYVAELLAVVTLRITFWAL
jgi:hypothetical protein